MAGPVAESTRASATYWPRWISALLIVTGLLIILAETSNLLVLIGIAVTGAGIYGAFHAGPRVGGSPSLGTDP
jgi:membrane-bound ClpP family serine protease